MRSPFFVTVDGASTRDIDDALYVEQDGDALQVHVAIADPVDLVPIGGDVDARARALAATQYRRDRPVRRMLPGRISEEQGSLVQGEPRQAMVFRMRLRQQAGLGGGAWQCAQLVAARERITVGARLTYEDLPGILGDAGHPAHASLVLGTTLSTQLLAQRRAAGALACFDLAQGWLTDEEGRLHHVGSQAAVIGHILVQEMMVLVNVQAGHYLAEHDIPGLYRVHARAGSAPASSVLASTIQGWLADGSAATISVSDRLEGLLGRAGYSAQIERHYGLNLPIYVHATSPLRRYADLVNLRQLAAHLDGEALPYDRAALAALAEELNQTIESQKAARSQAYKDKLYREVGKTVQDEDAAALITLAPHELSAAVNLGASAGVLAPALVQALLARLAQAEQEALPDEVFLRLLFRISPSVIPPALGHALGAWLWAQPARAAQLLNSGQQLGAVEITTTDLAAESGFMAQVQWRWADGQVLVTTGKGAQKKAALQQAICLGYAQRLPGAEATPPAAPAPRESTVDQESPREDAAKSALFIWAQKRRQPAPVFAVERTGPPHRPVFAATVALDGLTGTAVNALTRRQAEHRAAADLLRQLEAQSAPPAAAAVPVQIDAEDNPVRRLQEFAQKTHRKLPEYRFEILQGAQTSGFRCEVRVDTPAGALIFEAQEGSKQAAKARAAAAALLGLSAA